MSLTHNSVCLISGLVGPRIHVLDPRDNHGVVTYRAACSWSVRNYLSLWMLAVTSTFASPSPTTRSAASATPTHR